jgi:hypothetical protein
MLCYLTPETKVLAEARQGSGLLGIIVFLNRVLGVDLSYSSGGGGDGDIFHLLQALWKSLLRSARKYMECIDRPRDFN